MPGAFSYLVNRSWPVGLLALPFGAMYCLLLCVFSEAIEASEAMDDILRIRRGGGPATLFALNSALLAWAIVVFLEHRLGLTGVYLWPIMLGWSGIAIGFGFGVAILVFGRAPGPTFELIVLCGVSAVFAGGFRIHLADLF